MLTDVAIKALKPRDKLYKVVDRDGMYVVVQPSGAIVFRLALCRVTRASSDKRTTIFSALESVPISI